MSDITMSNGSQFNIVWDESLENGTGMLSRDWGPGIETNVPGQETLHSTPDNQDSGTMVPPTGADAGYGYGLYSFTLSMSQGDAPGPYALLWPSTDQWPGPELDLVEVLPGGQAYSTVHWKGDDGSNQYTPYMLDGVDTTKVHTYALDWEAGRLTLYVDGNQKWTTTDHVPIDAAHGGENEAPGVGMQTWWSADQQHGSGSDNALTLYDVSYAQLAQGGDGGSIQPSAGNDRSLAPVETGSGSDTIAVQVSGQSYQGSPLMQIFLDGKALGNPVAVTADHSDGQTQSVEIHTTLTAGQHDISVQMTNDLWVENTGDRNLYVSSIAVNGSEISGEQTLYADHDIASGTVSVDGGPDNVTAGNSGTLAPDNPPSDTNELPSIGAGSDVIVLRTSEDAYQGDAKYTVSVDGTQIDGVQSAHSLHGEGIDSLAIHGDWGAGSHHLTVNFLNDRWAGTPEADRNLYVEGASYNGHEVSAAHADLYSPGPVILDVQ